MALGPLPPLSTAMNAFNSLGGTPVIFESLSILQSSTSEVFSLGALCASDTLSAPWVVSPTVYDLLQTICGSCGFG